MLADIAFNPNVIFSQIMKQKEMIITDIGIITAAVSDSIEAILKGEHIILQNEATDKIREEQREKHRRGANAKHAPNRALKEETIKLYKNGNYKSMLNASKMIFPRIQEYADEQGITKLSTDSGRDTVYRWIREYKKPKNS